MTECYCHECGRITEHMGRDPWIWERLEGVYPVPEFEGVVEWECDEIHPPGTLYIRDPRRLPRPLVDMLPRMKVPHGAIEYKFIQQPDWEYLKP